MPTGYQLADFFKHVEMAEAALTSAWRDAKKKVAIQHWHDLERRLIHAFIEQSDAEPETTHLLKLLNLPTPLTKNTITHHELADEDFSTDEFDIDDEIDEDGDEFDEGECDRDTTPKNKSFEPLQVW